MKHSTSPLPCPAALRDISVRKKTNTIHRKVLTSSPVFCNAKYRGGVRKDGGVKTKEGLKTSTITVTNRVSHSPPVSHSDIGGVPIGRGG